MTFGSQLDERESFAIMDHAYESGIDFFDTAEVYPVPPKAEYVNRTEEILQTLTELQEEGKVRVIGSSNETEWGTMKANQVAQEKDFARYETIQNNFSINNRRLLTQCHRGSFFTHSGL